MFDEGRKAARESIRGYEPRRVDVLEAWALNKGERNHACQARSLEPHQLQPWIRQEGEYRPSPATRQHGGLRLIACDRKSLYPPSIAMAEDTLRLVEASFHLHPTTLQTLLSPTGTFSRHTDRSHGDPEKIASIQLLLKPPQNYEIANYGISLHFDAETRLTTALLFGERVTNTGPEIEKKESQTPNLRLRRKHVSPFDRLVHILKESRLPWDHPLLLPSAFLLDHMGRTRLFCEGRLAEKVYRMEKDIDVTKVGSRGDLGEDGLGPDYRVQELAFNPNPLFDRSRILSLTVHVNTLYTRVLFTQGSPTWNKEASQFLARVHREMHESAVRKTEIDFALSELWEYISNVASALETVVSSLQTRMELQLNILYSFTSQGDNRINERIALNSGRDSTSMKILALISALFLPATFVATLFSMSMFQWQPNGSDGDQSSQTVSDKIWIYPATAVPLTVVTVFGWGVWWWWELKKYDKVMDDHQVKDEKPAAKADRRCTEEVKDLVTSKTSRTDPYRSFRMEDHKLGHLIDGKRGSMGRQNEGSSLA